MIRVSLHDTPEQATMAAAAAAISSLLVRSRAGDANALTQLRAWDALMHPAMRERVERAEAIAEAERQYRVASNHAIVAWFTLSAAPPVCCVEDAERVAGLRDAARAARAAAVAAEDKLRALGVTP